MNQGMASAMASEPGRNIIIVEVNEWNVTDMLIEQLGLDQR